MSKIPGWETHEAYTGSYGFEEYAKCKGDGSNLLRTSRIAMPHTLRRGDIIGNGDRVLSNPRTGFNSIVLVHLTGGLHGHWIELPARIPIALLTPEDNAPEEILVNASNAKKKLLRRGK